MTVPKCCTAVVPIPHALNRCQGHPPGQRHVRVRRAATCSRHHTSVLCPKLETRHVLLPRKGQAQGQGHDQGRDQGREQGRNLGQGHVRTTRASVVRIRMTSRWRAYPARKTRTHRVCIHTSPWSTRWRRQRRGNEKLGEHLSILELRRCFSLMVQINIIS